MTGKTHIAASLGTGLAVVAYNLQTSLYPTRIAGTVPVYLIPAGLACCVAGGLFPDIDWHTSKVGSLIKPVSRFINIIFGHRTLFHSPFLLLLMYLALNHYYPDYIWFTRMFLVGAISHLALDMLNVKGIPLFYPHTRHYHLLRLKQDGFGESLIRKVSFGASVAFALVIIGILISRIRFFL